MRTGLRVAPRAKRRCCDARSVLLLTCGALFGFTLGTVRVGAFYNPLAFFNPVPTVPHASLAIPVPQASLTIPMRTAETAEEKWNAMRAMMEHECVYVDAGFGNWLVPQDCTSKQATNVAWEWFEDLHSRLVSKSAWEASYARVESGVRRSYMSAEGARADADVPQLSWGNAHFYDHYYCGLYLFDTFFSDWREELRGKGTFVEFGAQNGVKDSTTLLFQTYFEWSGLLIEPDANCVSQIQRSRVRAHGEVVVENAAVCGDAKPPTLSVTQGVWCSGRSKTVDVECPPLSTLLTRNALTHVDLLVADVEGSELDALKTVPWSEVEICVLLVEWREANGATRRDYMASHGYSSFRLPYPEHHTSNKVSDEIFWRPSETHCAYLKHINLNLPVHAFELLRKNGLRSSDDRAKQTQGKKLTPTCQPNAENAATCRPWLPLPH